MLLSPGESPAVAGSKWTGGAPLERSRWEVLEFSNNGLDQVWVLEQRLHQMLNMPKTNKEMQQKVREEVPSIPGMVQPAPKSSRAHRITWNCSLLVAERHEGVNGRSKILLIAYLFSKDRLEKREEVAADGRPWQQVTCIWYFSLMVPSLPTYLITFCGFAIR